MDEDHGVEGLHDSVMKGLLRSSLDDWLLHWGLRDEIDKEAYAFLRRVRARISIPTSLHFLTVHEQLFVLNPAKRPTLTDIMDDPFWGEM